MRPLTLAFTGIRSYTELQHIDFNGRDFIAIVGDTGSGKSTILDAICYALYNRCSWRSGSVSDLVAHAGDGTLGVAFTFRAGGTVWRVERSTTTRGGAPTHKLVTIYHDGTEKVTATGSVAVTTAIKRIIGLDYDTFLRSVILPQGRFQELLRMSDTDRSKILQSLLGLDQLGTIRDHAQAVHMRMSDRLAAYRERRALFLADPAATIAEALERQQSAGHRLDTLQEAQNAVAKATHDAAEARRRRTQLDDASRRLADAVPDGVDARYQTVLAARSEISDRRRQLDDEREVAAQLLTKLEDDLGQADREHTGVADTAAAVSTLTHIADQLPQLDAQNQVLGTEDSAVRSTKALLEQRRNSLAELQENARSARHTADQAASRAEEARKARDAAAAALAARRTAAQEAQRAERLLEQCEQEVLELKAAAQAAALDAAQAAKTVEDHEAMAVNLHAVATAAAGCGPGDLCPICRSELPTDFQPPSNDDTEQASSLLRAARRAATKAANHAATTTGSARVAEEQTLPERRQAAETAAAELATATTRVQEMLGDVDLTRPDDDLLRLLTDQTATLDANAQAAAEIREDLNTKATQAASELPVLEQACTDRETRQLDSRARHDEALAALYRAARKLPPTFRPDLDLPLADVIRQRDLAIQRQSDLKKLTDQRTQTRERLDGLNQRTQDLDNEHRERVTKAVDDLHRTLQALTVRASDAETLLQIPAHPPIPAAGPLDDQSAWANSMLKHVNDLIARCSAAADAEEAAAKTAASAAEAARRSCQATDDDHLEQLVRAASTALHNAHRDHAKAVAQQPLADELTRRINGAAPTVDALADLLTLLTAGKFIANAVRQRQTALLRAASATLLEISGGRYGFGENFRILDTDTSRPRDVHTLSGGETFQASLALALAVVELASRASGRVDCLFLDEGFGSLDSGVLRDALSTLANHSSAGRQVTVISHMRSIVEITDHVLVVDRTFAGSRAHWANPQQRDQIINDDLSRGMLA